jgi:hypothetical protein
MAPPENLIKFNKIDFKFAVLEAPPVGNIPKLPLSDALRFIYMLMNNPIDLSPPFE